jgi:hypothetical protein
MKKIIPWALLVILSIAYAATFYQYEKTVKLKDAEIEDVKNRYAQFVAATNTKLDQARSMIEQADSRAQTVAIEAENKVQLATTEANSKIQELSNDMNSKIQSLSVETSKKLKSANLPEATALVTFRKALISSGSVAVIKNTSSQSIAITLTTARPTSNQRKNFDLIIDAGKFKEIGEREGWAFLKGDIALVSQPEHKSLQFVFN